MARPPILIVEDDSSMADTLDSIVRLLGYNTIITHSAQAALDASAEERPDLVLLDLNLPDFDGFELCQRLKARPAFKNTPILFVSAESDPEIIQRARHVGVSRFLVKPIGLDDLEKAIAETLIEAEETNAQDKGAP